MDDKNLPETNAEDISSNDLLSQIDDILNSSATSDTPVEVPQTETTDTNASLDEIPDITDLANTPVTSDETNTEEPTITEDNSDAVIAAAYKTSEDYNAIAEWLDQCVDGNVSNTYMASLQEALDGKSAEDVMADMQKAAKEVADANK